MPNQAQSSIENSFIGGLKTEFTGLNFPENACTDADNCIFSIIGTVDRRLGINYETNFQLNSQNSSEVAINTYKWNNVGGDGLTQIVVTQIGSTLYFYLASSAAIANPLSTKKLTSTVDISTFVASGGSFDPTIECQFADGNGYLFIFNSNCDPFYCTYNSNTQTITANIINVQIRDFQGIFENISYTFRPSVLTAEHNYNLINQGWNLAWTGNIAIGGVTTYTNTGTFTYTLDSSTLPIVTSSTVQITINPASAFNPVPYMTATVVSYIGNQLTVSITGKSSGDPGALTSFFAWAVTPSPNDIYIWNTMQSNYPSNSDQWWQFKDTNINTAAPTGTFNPTNARVASITLDNAPAPKGAIILNAFNQDRTAATTIAGLTTVSTLHRPTNGCWYQGRVFYTGVNANFQASGDAIFNTWTENIYFSQIVQTPADFPKCYQINDPTSENLFDLLPSDGGVITIQGTGSIFKLFPVQNGLLIFAANGIWFITGSQGIGFSATDYTVTKISGIQSIALSSYVNVLGWPLFWNEEGIYHVQPSKDGAGLTVNNLCLGTILSFYNEIPLQSKKFARGDYNPITYVVQWIYKSANETDITSRYQFDRMLNLNTYKAPFYPYTIANATGYPWIAGVNYVAGPGGSTSPDPLFKYFTTINNTRTTFSEENDFTTWLDWSATGLGIDYNSTFTTGYKLHGSAWKLWQLGYIYMFSDNTVNTSYKIRGLWNYSTSGNSGKWSTSQQITNAVTNFSNVFRKIRIRGHGLAMQLQVTSVTGFPFNFAGWSTWENINQGI